MAERGGFVPPQAQNDDGAEDFDVIDISKLKTVVAETGVSRKVPPSTHQVPQNRNVSPSKTGGEWSTKRYARTKNAATMRRCASIAVMSAMTNAFQINGNN
jgi:hypothetical protein